MSDAPTVGPATPGPDTMVTAFSGVDVYWQSVPDAGADNKRKQEVTVQFPEMPLAYDKITLHLSLTCPKPTPPGMPTSCDQYDRRAHLGVVRRIDGVESVTEIARFMTPFGWPAKWSLDVTSLRPLLSGNVTLQLFIDTWVGPMSGALGLGWKVDAIFEMHGGLPARLPVAVIPLWDAMSFEYGNPMKPVSGAVKPQTVKIPTGATAVELRSFITGHGQGNAGNCAEFCQREHGFTVGDAPLRRTVWRNDCQRTAMHGSTGTWMYPRAGWCPGADVVPWVEDVTASAPPGKEVTISYGVAPYENTCRPDAATCAGCVFNTGCAYNSGAHTMPVFVMSSALVVYGSGSGP
jgi:hypothetical protein